MDIKFIKKLKQQEVLTLIETSANLTKDYLNKSEKFFLSGKLLLENEYLESSISDIYYSMYYSLLALLYKCGIKSENHEASIFFLDYLFNRNNLYHMIKKAKRERIEKQYFTKTETSVMEVKEILNLSKKFNLEIKKFIDSMLDKDIEKIRNKFIEI